MKKKIIKNESEKILLFNRLSNDNISLMFFFDEIPDKEIHHEILAGNIFLVHPPFDYNILQKWLYPGNWQAIYPANAAYKPINTFKMKSSDIENTMNSYSLDLIIDSFHDNIEWCIIEKT